MKKITFMFVFTLMAVLTHAQTETYYVKADGDDSNDGTTVDFPLKTIQEAVDKAGASIDTLEVYVVGFVNDTIVRPLTNTKIIGQDSEGIEGTINGNGTGGDALEQSFILLKNLDDIQIALKDLTIQNMYTNASGSIINVNGSKCEGIKLVVENCKFIDNCTGTTVDKNDNTVLVNGGVIAISNVKNYAGNDFSLDIKKCFFKGIGSSKPASNGGAIYVFNDAINVSIENSTFRNFYATSKAGTISISKAKTFKGVNLTIADNQCTASTDESAGIQLGAGVAGVPELQNSIVINNSTPNFKVSDVSKNINLRSENIGLLVKNCLIGSVVVGDYATSVIEPSKFTNSIYGDKDGVGAPGIDGFAFDAAENVYKFNDGSYPVLRGKSMFLSELKDQNNNSRGPEGTVDVDAGAWHSGYTNVASVVSHESLSARLKVYKNSLGKLVVNIPGARKQNASIYSVLGVKLFDVAVENEFGILDGSQLKSGVYLIYLDLNGSIIAQKFIIE